MYYFDIFRKQKLFTAISSSQLHLQVPAEHQHTSLAQTKAQMRDSESQLTF